MKPGLWKHGLLVPLLCLTACAKSADEIKQESKQELLRALPEQVIVPAYRNFASAIGALGADIDRYCAGQGNADLQSLQEHWRYAMTAWQETAAYAFGPVAAYDLPALINYPAVRKSKLDYWLQPGRLAGAGELKTYSVQGKGLGALEYLLFGPGPERTTPQYCAYLSALAADLAANADRIIGFWQAPVDEAAVDTQPRVDELLDAVLQAMETVKDEKLGVPLGRKNGGAAQPGKAESRLSGHSLQNIRANIVSLQNIFYGMHPALPVTPNKRGFGMEAYLHKTGKPELAVDLEEKLRQILHDLAQIPALQVAIQEKPALVEALHRDVSELCILLETAVLPAFDAQPGFNARDGD